MINEKNHEKPMLTKAHLMHNSTDKKPKNKEENKTRQWTSSYKRRFLFNCLLKGTRACPV